MTTRLEESLLEQKQQTQQEVQQIPGMLGIPLGGQRLVEVPDRNSYLYVRLRNNQSEVIQAYNNQVAPAYNLPVLVERHGNRYVVIGVDSERYENNWNSFAPFLPRHGNTHSFDIESGGGGDIVWVYPRQIIPSLVMPSGSLGAGNVFVNAYTLKKNDNSWMYTGNTGTADLLTYRPSSPTGAVMALVYLDVTTGNPMLFVNSGTVFNNIITGSSQIAPYIPSLTDPTTQIPLAAVRLITGTNAISWDNIYDVRQWIHPSPTGTGGGGSLTIQDEGVSQGTATTLNFVGDNVQATVTGATARIFITGSAGGGINTGTLDARYLKLDASNDPVTGGVEINVVRNGAAENYALEVYGENPTSILNALYLESAHHNAIEAVVHGDNYLVTANIELPTGTNNTTPTIDLHRFARGTGTILNSAAFHVTDYQAGMEPQSGFLKNVYNFTGTTPDRTLSEINPYAIPTGIVTMLDTLNQVSSGGRLLLLRNQGQDMVYVGGDGTINIPSGTTYNIGGTPHSHSSSSSVGKYIITPSISSGGLSVAIKYLDGNDATSTNILTFRVGNTEYDLTTSASYTKSSGTNWHGAGGTMFAAKDVDFFMYAIGETGASAGLKFGHSRISHATTMGDFVNTITDAKYIAGNWTNFNSTDPVVVIGRFRAQLSGTSAFVWSIPTVKVINYPVYESDWMTYLPTYSAGAPMTFGTVTTSLAIYQVRWASQEVKADFNGTTATGASNIITFTLPFSAASLGTGLAYGSAYVLDAAASAGYWRVYPGGFGVTGVEVLKGDESNFGLGASRYTRGSIITPI